MANGLNRSSVAVSLTDVHLRIIRDTVNLKFYNVRLASEKSQATVDFVGVPVVVPDLPADPNGLTQVFITPKKFRSKSIFANVQADGSTQINEVFFVDPDKVTPRFPAFSDIQTLPNWTGLLRLLNASNISTAQAWDVLKDQPRAGLLNLYCKMQATLLAGGRTVADLVQRIEKFEPARILARVDPNLINLVGSATQTFHTVSGALHPFDPPWQPTTPENSWKTFDKAGNLQVTLATDGHNNFLADIDIDDHQGVQHAFDVLQHAVTGKDTNPFDIHEILIFFQNLDPGYLFV